MYEAFYGLTDKPFQLNPDPNFYFDSRQHRRATAYLEYGLHRNEGFIVVTGEVGAGKTTLVRNLFSHLDPKKVVAANLVSTHLDADNMLRMVAAAFGIPSRHANKSDLLLSIEAFLVSLVGQGKRCLLVVDEAQNLTRQAVEELRMLSNFQLEEHALLQSFLIGQPEFRHMLESPHMKQLRQRVIAACHVGPLDQAETRGYVEHRLSCVGWKDFPRFQVDAYEEIYKASGGIPRRINAVCDRVLLSGFLAEKKEFSGIDVVEVATELHDETVAPKSPVRIDADGDSARADLSAENIDWSRFEIDDATLEAAHKAIGVLDHADLEGRLSRLELSVRRLDRSNKNALELIGQLIKHLRSGGPGVDGSGET